MIKYLPLLFLALVSCVGAGEDLEKDFKNPPDEVKPYVWWHWMGPNFSKEGITRDLEAMKLSGIGGATIFNLSSAVQESHAPTLNNPWPEQTYRSKSYWDAIKYAAEEADRLGLELGLHNTVGYSTTGGPWIDEERSMQQLVWSDTTVTGRGTVVIPLKPPLIVADEGWGKTGRKVELFTDIAVLAIPAGPEPIPLDKIIDLTGSFDSVSGLKWSIPAGKWRIIRIAHASTGRPPHPVPDDLLGKVLEADKMSAAQTEWHWKNVLEPLIDNIGEHTGKSFRHVLIDSYEAGDQNWTPGMREEFIRIKGYDPLPWLVSFALTSNNSSQEKEIIIESEEKTRRFQYDYNDVINRLFQENGWKLAAEIIHKNGLELQFEPYGGPFNTPDAVYHADLPMTEFWTTNRSGINPILPAAAGAAGKRIIGAEAFTGRPEVSKYTEDPAFLKMPADKAFSQGVNRMILHHWVHQPFDDRYLPGMGMGWWGTHFGRNQTWFEDGKAFMAYLARCQTLLQHGEPVTEMLSVGTLSGPSDLISENYFIDNELIVDEGKIFLPSGRSYSILIFTDSIMHIETATKIRDLAAKGAVIVTPVPSATPGLKGFPADDLILKEIAAELTWQDASPQGKHRVFRSIGEAIIHCGLQSDHLIRGADSPQSIGVRHRRSGETDVWFISNLSEISQNFQVSLNIAGKEPELWQAEDGTINKAPVWECTGGRTEVLLSLKGLQSVFIVFRKQDRNSNHPVAVLLSDTTASFRFTSGKKGHLKMAFDSPASGEITRSSGKRTKFVTEEISEKELNGEWEVTFSPKADTGFTMMMKNPEDFSNSTENRIRYFSGTAVYKISFTYEEVIYQSRKRVFLDLGTVNDIVRIKLNENEPVVIWYPPFETDITDLIKKGRNELEIAVTNNWANRMIGDEQEPPDFEWGKDRGVNMGRAMLAYPEWFINNQARPSGGRKTFSIWYYFRENSGLYPAGLAGPVKIKELPVIDL